jgi:hypothetical protein
MMRIISASLTLHDTKIRIEQIIVFRTGYGTQNTIEFLGMWERLNNPDFNPIEFDGFKKQSASVGRSQRWGYHSLW